MHIRSYRPKDESAVVELWRLCGLFAPQNDPHIDILRKLEVNPEWFLVGELDGVLIGSCMAGYDGHRGSINYLAIHPDYRRRGYASGMMAESERRLREAGCPKINLMIRTSNTAVRAFYERQGFSEDAVVCFGKRLIPDSPADSNPRS